MLAGLAVGLVVGAVNGGLVSLLGIPSFLVTLGMLGIAFGLAQWITNTAPQPILNDSVQRPLRFGATSGRSRGSCCGAAQRRHRGAWSSQDAVRAPVLATGGNRVAARVHRRQHQARSSSWSCFSRGSWPRLAGMLYAGRLQSGRFQWGAGDELSAIAAVILGGTSLFGGNGSVVGSLFGALMIGLINNGLILAGLESSQQQVVRGAIIILAVALARKK